MTDYDTLEAGPELDALVAEKVMGCRPLRTSFQPMCGCGKHGGNLPKYSIEISDAWAVLQKFNDHDLVVVVGSKRILPERKIFWYALVGMARPVDEFDMSANILGEAEAETAPLAICRAGLKAIASMAAGKGMSDDDFTAWLTAVVDAQTEYHTIPPEDLPKEEPGVDAADEYWGFFRQWREDIQWTYFWKDSPEAG